MDRQAKTDLALVFLRTSRKSSCACDRPCHNCMSQWRPWRNALASSISIFEMRRAGEEDARVRAASAARARDMHTALERISRRAFHAT